MVQTDGFDSLQSLNAVDDRGLADVDAERAAGNRGPEMTQQGQGGGVRESVNQPRVPAPTKRTPTTNPKKKTPEVSAQ